MKKKLVHSRTDVTRRPSPARASHSLTRVPAARWRWNGSDSGRVSIITRAIRIGMAPPTQKMMLQSRLGMPTSSPPAIVPPNGMAADSMVTRMAASCGRPDSAVSAMMLGSAPPRPSPVRKRVAIRALLSLTSAVAMLKTPNVSIEAISTLRRPTLSASRPPTMAPRNRPNVLALKTQLRCAGSRWNRGANFGAVRPADCRS